MNTLTQTLLVPCFLAPLLAGAGPLDVYGNLTGKTVLAPSSLPALSDTITSDLPTGKTNAIAKIESELAKQGLAVVNDGPHFVRVFRERERDFWKSVPLRGEELARTNSPAAVDTGEISFMNAELTQVLPIYAAISGRTVLRSMLASPPVRLKSIGPLTREEINYAITTVLALNGVAIVEDGEKFVQVVPMPHRSLVTTQAPKPSATETLLDPNKVPSIGDSKPKRPLTQWERDLERWQKAFYDFIHYKSPPERPVQRLLDLYAKLADKTAESSKDFDGLPIWFHVDTPLTKSELLYAIQTTFTLNNLAIINVDDKRIRLDRVGKPQKGASQQDVRPKIANEPQKPVEK